MQDASDGATTRWGQLTPYVEEKLRAFSTRITHQIMLRRGQRLGMWFAGGFPKSGTSWVADLMGTALGVPMPREYQLPIMMRSVVHGHWRYDPRMTPAVYVRRDGRDVMVSYYFFLMRALELDRNPTVKRGLVEIFDGLFGPGWDPDDSRGNMPRFVEYLMGEAPFTKGLAWHQHIDDWWDRPRVGHVTYEELQADTASTLARGLSTASGEPFDLELAEIAARRYDFSRAAGRRQGQEDRGSFHRKGIVGDWRNHFTAEAGEVFDSYAGDALVEFGYEADRDWFRSL